MPGDFSSKRFPSLGKLSIAIIEHLVEPVLGDNAIKVIKAPLVAKELQDALVKALENTEERFVAEYSDAAVCEAILNLPLSYIPSVKQAALAFVDRPTDEKFGQILVDQLAKNFTRFSSERIEAGVRAYQKTFLEELVSLSSETREKISALAILKINESTEQIARKLAEMANREKSDEERLAEQNLKQINVFYKLHTSFLEGTRLQLRHLLHSGQKSANIADRWKVFREIAEEFCHHLLGEVPLQETTVRVQIDRSGKVILTPNSAWASYYAFPSRGGFSQPGTDLHLLGIMVQSQLAWRLDSRTSQIPLKPLGKYFEPIHEYLEIRLDGYQPAFLPLKQIKSGDFEITLYPVLNKRIAVIGFSSNMHNNAIPDYSESIAQGIIHLLEQRPELATYGYLSDKEKGFHGRPVIEIGNQILNLTDVKEVEGQLEFLNNVTVSGEGRHLKRKSLDIHYVISGNYELS